MGQLAGRPLGRQVLDISVRRLFEDDTEVGQHAVDAARAAWLAGEGGVIAGPVGCAARAQRCRLAPRPWGRMRFKRPPIPTTASFTTSCEGLRSWRMSARLAAFRMVFLTSRDMRFFDKNICAWASST